MTTHDWEPTGVARTRCLRCGMVAFHDSDPNHPGDMLEERFTTTMSYLMPVSRDCDEQLAWDVLES